MMSFLGNLMGALKKKDQGHRSDPGRDWLMLLAVTAVLLAISIGWNIWFFRQVVQEGNEDVSGSSGALQGYESTRVEEIFNSRAEAALHYREVYPFVDPSVRGE